jgi:hyperosmotically inducible protein
MKYLLKFTVFFVLLFIILTPVTFAGTTDQPIEDNVITAKIDFKVAMDKSISIFKVKISTLNGIVTFSGMVDSVSHAEALVEIAQGTDGVVDVNTDHLQVKHSKRPIIDTLITAKIKALLIKNNVYSGTIHVETTNGVVYLTGTAKNQDDIDTAIKTAKLLKGIKSVDSRIEVKH